MTRPSVAPITPVSARVVPMGRDTTTPITADIFHDLTCPWCRIGIAQFRRALDGWDGPPVELHWHPFLLDPDAPRAGQPFRAALAARMGQDPTPMLERVSEAGAAAGVAFAWDRIERLPSTVAAHVLYAILPPDRRTGLIDRLHAAWFSDGRDIGDPDTLLTIAGDYGMDRELTAQSLAEEQLHEAIRSEARQAAEMGISGVPLVILDNRVAVSGAQPAEQFRAALDETLNTRG